MSYSRFGVGDYLAGEGSILHRGRLSAPASDRLLVVCHGRTPGTANGCLQWTQAASGGSSHLLYLADHGYTALAVDAGGSLTWGNDTSVAAVVSAVAWARTQGVCHPTAKVGLVGYSMGNVVALNYIRTHASNVAAYIGYASPYDLDTFHSDSTYTAEIDTAYPSGYSTNNPANFAGSITTPTRLHHAVDDSVVPLAQGQALEAALGSTDKSLTQFPDGDHSAFWPHIDAAGLRTWLDSQTWT